MVYEVARTIDSTPDEVWAVLADGPGYSTWDNGVVRVEGTIAPGEKLRIFSEIDPKRGFPAKVTEFDPHARMTWSGGMPLGLFKGVRTFDIAPTGAGTRFTMREEFSGPLLGMIAKRMPDLGPSFEQFAEGLKARVEGGSS